MMPSQKACSVCGLPDPYYKAPEQHAPWCSVATSALSAREAQARFPGVATVGYDPASGAVACGGCAGGGCFPPSPSEPFDGGFVRLPKAGKRHRPRRDPILEGMKEIVGMIAPLIVQMGADQQSNEARQQSNATRQENAQQRLIVASARLSMGSAFALCSDTFSANAGFRMLLDAARMDVESALIDLTGDVDLRRVTARSTVGPAPTKPDETGSAGTGAATSVDDS